MPIITVEIDLDGAAAVADTGGELILVIARLASDRVCC